VGRKRNLQDKQAAGGPPGGAGDNDASNTRGWFKLLRGGKNAYAKGKQLICQSSRLLKHSPEGSRAGVLSSVGVDFPVYDFNGAYAEDGVKAGRSATPATELAEFSYSFQVTLKWIDTSQSIPVTWGQILTNTQDPGKPIAADRNPYSNHVPTRGLIGVNDPNYGGWGLYHWNRTKTMASMMGWSLPPLKAGTSQEYVNALRRGRSANSRNHKQEGQNVCYLDGHAKWANSPKAGVDDDSIWSNWVHIPNAGAGKLDFEVCDNNTMPCDAEPLTDTKYGSMRPKSNWLTDAVLIP